MEIDDDMGGRYRPGVILALDGGASKSLAQRRADAPLRPAVEQRPIEHGLFGDRQLDLADRLDLKP